jgi:HD-GYP domain-containing protein (c-di-GMP phosphodiesterase class II)
LIRIAVAQLEAGMELARPLFDPADPMLDLREEGFVLDAGTIATLGRFGIRDAWIRDDRAAELDDRLPPHAHAGQRAALGKMRSALAQIADENSVEFPLREIHGIVSDLLKIARDSHLQHAHYEYLSASGNELASHSTLTCFLTLQLALRMERYLSQNRSSKKDARARDIVNLGIGALLHDVGLLQIPQQLRDFSQPLTGEEAETWKQHTVLGFHAARRRLDANAANIILNHHQRWDGYGYPQRASDEADEAEQGLAGDQIPPFSRIVGLVNHFARLVQAPGSHSQNQMPVQALFEIRFGAFRGWFEPDVERAFYTSVPPFPPGSLVRLSTGERAVVLEFNSMAPCQPGVRILTNPQLHPLPENEIVEIDLSATPEIHIREFEGAQISQFLF